MEIRATRIIIRSADAASWYSASINEQFWAENVGGDYPWRVLQEGTCFPTRLHVHKEDAEPLGETTLTVGGGVARTAAGA